MEDQDSGSSSGMVIGMIVGGVVILVLVVLVFLGGAIFWTFEARPAPGGGPVAGPVMMVDEAPPPGAPGPVADIQVAKPREHLFGVWDARLPDDGAAVMEFRKDGTLIMTDKAPGKADATQPAVRWEIRADNGGYKLKLEPMQGEPIEHVVRFLDGGRLLVETMQGRIYQRRAMAP